MRHRVVVVLQLFLAELRQFRRQLRLAIRQFGDLVRFTIRLDRDGRLTSAGSAVSRPLTGPDGAILTPKANADAEGHAILADGEVLVSFERDHRIWS